jgi:hypothetical protein
MLYCFYFPFPDFRNESWSVNLHLSNLLCVCVEKSKLFTVPFAMDSDLTIPQTFPNTRSCLRIVTVCICADRNDVQREVPLFVFLFNKTLQTQPNGTVLEPGQVEGRDLLVFNAETRAARLHARLNNI